MSKPSDPHKFNYLTSFGRYYKLNGHVFAVYRKKVFKRSHTGFGIAECYGKECRAVINLKYENGRMFVIRKSPEVDFKCVGV